MHCKAADDFGAMAADTTRNMTVLLNGHTDRNCVVNQQSQHPCRQKKSVFLRGPLTCPDTGEKKRM